MHNDRKTGPIKPRYVRRQCREQIGKPGIGVLTETPLPTRFCLPVTELGGQWTSFQSQPISDATLKRWIPGTSLLSLDNEAEFSGMFA